MCFTNINAFTRYNMPLLTLAHQTFIKSMNIVLAFGFCFSPTFAVSVLHALCGEGEGRAGVNTYGPEILKLFLLWYQKADLDQSVP